MRAMTEDFIEHFALGRQHNDGALGLFADLAADLPAVELREHDVEQHEVRVDGIKHLHGRLAVVCNGCFKAFLFNIQS